MDIKTYLRQPVDLQLLVDGLEFEESALEQAEAEHASLFLKAAKFKVKRMLSHRLLEIKYDVLKSQTGIRYRQEKAPKTETELKEQVTINSRIIKMRRRLARAEAYEELAKLLVDAYWHKQTVIKIFAETKNQEIAHELREVKRGSGLDELRAQSKRIRSKMKELRR